MCLLFLYERGISMGYVEYDNEYKERVIKSLEKQFEKSIESITTEEIRKATLRAQAALYTVRDLNYICNENMSETTVGEQIEKYFETLYSVFLSVKAGEGLKDAFNGYKIAEEDGWIVIIKAKKTCRFKNNKEAAEYASKYDGIEVIDTSDYGIYRNGSKYQYVVKNDSSIKKVFESIKSNFSNDFDEMRNDADAMKLRRKYQRDLDNVTYKNIGEFIKKNGIARLIKIVDDSKKLTEAIGRSEIDSGSLAKIKGFLTEVDTAFLNGASYKDCVRGFVIAENEMLHGVLEIQKADNIDMFVYDRETAEYAKAVYGVDYIDTEKEYGVKVDDSFGYYLRTSDNIKKLKEYSVIK